MPNKFPKYDPKVKQIARMLRKNSTRAEILLWNELLVLAFKNGLSYFASLTVLLGYAILVVVAATVGQKIHTETQSSQEGQAR